MLKKPIFLEMIVLLLAVGMLHLVANIYHLYWSIYEFDSVVHFFAGAAMSAFFLWLYFYSDLFRPRKRTLTKFLVISILGAMFVGLSWEIYELIFRQAFVHKASYSYNAIMDLIMDFLGALAFCFYGYLKEHNSSKQ